MRNKKSGIIFLLSTVFTIGLLFTLLGKPCYVKNMNEHCKSTKCMQP